MCQTAAHRRRDAARAISRAMRAATRTAASRTSAMALNGRETAKMNRFSEATSFVEAVAPESLQPDATDAQERK